MVMDIGTNADGSPVNATFNRGLGGQLISTRQNNVNFHYLHDGRGSVIGLMNNSGQSVANYRFDAFGEHLRDNSTIHNPFGYRGEYHDWESGMQYLRNRYYDPSIGRFINEDPYWNVGNMRDDIAAIMQSNNLYVYVMNNPLRWIDPWGLRNLDPARGDNNLSEVFQNAILDLSESWFLADGHPEIQARISAVANAVRAAGNFRIGPDPGPEALIG